MFKLILLIVGIYFFVGGAVIWYLNSRSDEKTAAERRVKYLTYLLIVYAILFLARYASGWFFILGLVIFLLGLLEIRKVSLQSFSKGSMLLYLGVYGFICFFFLMFCTTKSSHQLLWVYTLVLCFDGFSQLAGQLFGKHKLAASVSPGKTIEGLTGGVFFSCITAAQLHPYMGLDFVSYYSQVLLLLFAALVGDLLASYYKRRCGIKNYSSLIPGHGGVLDRFDSFIAAACMYEISSYFLL